MGKTAIAYTWVPAPDGRLFQGYSFNPWWGCSAVSPGCDNCFAELVDSRTGGDHWGPRKTPRVMSDGYWKEPFRWNVEAERSGTPRNVLTGTMCDWADKNAPAGQRERLWALIKSTRMLNYLLLTKRHSNILKYLPPDWGEGYENAPLGVSVDDRKHGLPRIQRLQDVPARLKFLSIEPLLEPLGKISLEGIDWVIVGGEKAINPRTMELAWVLDLLDQCRHSGVPFFYKQKGGRGNNDGGHLIDGQVIREYPVYLLHRGI